MSKSPLSIADSGIALYVHVPFCLSKCPYCDFNTYQGIEGLMVPYAKALSQELTLWGRVLGGPRINTVFFGGGTPSYLGPASLGRVMETISSSFELSKGAEVTVEANPGDLTPDTLAGLKSIGATRLSIGVQSLDDGLLKLLGRRHSADEALAAHSAAREAGFDKVNLDLIYGLPGQTLGQWQDTVESAAEAAPGHLSLYALTLEEGTPMEQWVRRGTLPEPDPDLAADMYELASERLARAGYVRYEISNWALSGHESLHNKAYWLNLPYLGVGPGAHSRLGCRRFWTVKPPRDYIRLAEQWRTDSVGVAKPAVRIDDALLGSVLTVDGWEEIPPELDMAETMILGLRLTDGVDVEAFKDRFSADPFQLYGAQIDTLTGQGLLESSGGRLRLTDKGCLLSNRVFVEFL